MSGEFVFPIEIVHPADKKHYARRKAMEEYYLLKHNLCRRFAPKVIAEIGVRAGYSAYSFLRAVETAKYYGFDANNNKHGGQGQSKHDWWSWAKNTLSSYNCTFVECDTQTLSTLKDCVTGVDFFHIDGDHSEKGVYHDLNLAAEVLNPNGVMLVDDITYIPEVKRGADSWLSDHSEYSVEFVKSLRGEYLISLEVNNA